MKRIAITLIITAALLMLFSCATTSGDKDFSPYRLTSFSIYDGSENLLQSLSIRYGEMNKPVEINTLDSEGEVLSRRVMSYSATGKLVILENISGQSSSIRSEYTYDESDFLIRVLTMNEDDKVLATASYINDDRGNPIEWTSKAGRDGQLIHFLVEYDEADRVTKTTELDSAGSPIYYSLSEYDDEGNELSYTIYSPEGLIDQQLLNYYSDGALIKSDIVNENRKVLYSTVYELDENRNPLLISNYNQYGDRADYSEIIYDSEGREIERRTYNYEDMLVEKTIKEYDQWGNNSAVIIYGSDDIIHSITRNIYEEQPLHMTAEEFNSLVFKLR